MPWHLQEQLEPRTEETPAGVSISVESFRSYLSVCSVLRTDMSDP